MPIITSEELESLTRLGKTVRIARLRRNMSQSELAFCMGVSRSSVVMLEKGAPGTSIAILLKALSVFGYTERLGTVLVDDPIGEDAVLPAGRKRGGYYPPVADF